MFTKIAFIFCFKLKVKILKSLSVLKECRVWKRNPIKTQLRFILKDQKWGFAVNCL